MSQTQISAPLTRDQAYALVDAVAELEDLALTVSAYENQDGEWVFEATCDREPDVEAFNTIAAQTLGGAVAFKIEKIDPAVDWIAKSLEGLPPVSAGGFFIHAGHNFDEIPAGVIPIHIEAAQAFGTGHHETTTGCLEAIYGVLKDKRPKRILDVGTGTGVLAIALAKRLRRTIIASDIDPIAVTTTIDNAKLNNVKKWITAIQATGLNDDKIVKKGPYGLIVANILAGPLADLAPDISAAAKSGATIILSGILNTQAETVIAAYEKNNIVLSRRILLKEWTTLVLEKT